MKFYSPLRYPGGKSSLALFFEQLIKKNSLNNGIYIEPYAGGAGAALSLLLHEKVGKIVINDLDRAIYSFWKAAIYESYKFIDKVQSVNVDINEWHKQRNIYKDKNASEFDLGFATFFLNRTNRSGIVEGGPIGGIKQESQWEINIRFNKKALVDRIKKISLYKERIIIKNEDGIDLLRQFRRQKNVFLYLDPPYYQKGGSLYLNHYKNEDHKKLAAFLNENVYLNWLLTYDNVEDIKNLYAERRIKRIFLNYSAYKKTKGSELMIFSDSLKLN